MEPVLQAIDDQRIEALELVTRGLRKIADVAAIGEVPHAEAERHDIAMHLKHGQKGDGPAGTRDGDGTIGVSIRKGSIIGG